MTDLERKGILHGIEGAKKAIAEAQRDLTSVLGELETGQRAEKRHVGEPVNLALDRLRVALAELGTLEDLLAK